MPQVDVLVDSEGNVSCVPDPVPVGKSWRTVVIHWNMQTAGWMITGIAAPGGEPLDDEVFYSSKKEGKTDWKIKDKNSAIKDYEYEVQVSNTVTGECKAHDPVIRNGGRR